MSAEILIRPRALSFGEHAERPPHIRLVNLLLRDALHPFELQESRSLLVLRHVIVKLRGRSSRTLRILEDIQTVVLALFDELDCLLEILVSLARETNDDIARQRQSPAGTLDTFDSCEIVASFMPAAHQLQNPIAA